jgi:hypothetical protein
MRSDAFIISFSGVDAPPSKQMLNLFSKFSILICSGV